MAQSWRSRGTRAEVAEEKSYGVFAAEKGVPITSWLAASVL